MIVLIKRLVKERAFSEKPKNIEKEDNMLLLQDFLNKFNVG